MTYLLKCLRSATIGIAGFTSEVGTEAREHPGGLLLFIGCLWVSILLVATAPLVGTPLVLLFWGYILADAPTQEKEVSA